jgi:hypothetical protein
MLWQQQGREGRVLAALPLQYWIQPLYVQSVRSQRYLWAKEGLTQVMQHNAPAGVCILWKGPAQAAWALQVCHSCIQMQMEAFIARRCMAHRGHCVSSMQVWLPQV